MFLSRIASNGGPMDGVLSDAQRNVVKAWIDAGAPAPAAPVADVPVEAPEELDGGAAAPVASLAAVHAEAPEELRADDGLELDADMSQLHWKRPFIGQGGVH
jgi:hypothetical protein